MSEKDNDGKRKNPWGNVSGEGNRKRNNPWGGPSNGGYNNNSGGNNRGQGPNDFDDLIRNAQQGLKEALPGNLPPSLAIIGVVLIVIALWLASGFHIINPGEYGVIQRFGAWSRTQTNEGLGYHLPAPIEKITKVNVSQQRVMNIGYAEDTFRGVSSTNKRNIPDESQMLTSDRNIVELHVAIQWDIKSAEDYLFEIKNQENTIKKVAESAIREVVGQTEMFPILTKKRTEAASSVKDIIQKNLDEYNSGVNIKQVLIQKATVHPDVLNAFQDVQSASQDAENTTNLARAEREKILPEARGQAIKIKQEAEGYKQSKIAQATGDASRFEAIYKAYLSGKDVTKERIYIETMEEVLKNANKIILDENGGVVPYLPIDQLGNNAKRKGQ